MRFGNRDIFVKTFKKIMMILVIIMVVAATGLFYSPAFLAYSTNYEKADAVVLLLGPDFSARQKHAYDLARRGMADCVIIPAYNRAYFFGRDSLNHESLKMVRNNIYEKNDPSMPGYYEDTHLELIAAKKTMELYGQKSAIFVSSPYHMRRIQVIVAKEFDSQSRYYFSPTPYDPAPLSVWELKASDWRKMWREYIKILWFMIYFPWTK